MCGNGRPRSTEGHHAWDWAKASDRMTFKASVSGRHGDKVEGFGTRVLGFKSQLWVTLTIYSPSPHSVCSSAEWGLYASCLIRKVIKKVD